LRRVLWLSFLVLFSPGMSLAGEIIRGHYCYTCQAKETMEEGRYFARTLAIRDAVESSNVFQETAGPLKDLRWTDDIIQILASGYLDNLRVIDHREEGTRICDTVEAGISPDIIRAVVEREAGKRRKRIEDLGVANNGSLKILGVAKIEGDRYGRRIEVIVKVLRPTGSLYPASERNKKPFFKVCIDYFDALGMPVGGEGTFIHDSDVELLPGEIRILNFYAPPDGVSYRIWLGGSPGKTVRGGKRASGRLETPSTNTRKGSGESRRLEEIVQKASEGELRVDLFAGGPIKAFRYFFMNAPPRLVIDLRGTWETQRDSSLTVTQRVAKKIRIGKHPDKLRVVIDLKDGAFPPSATIQETREGLAIILKATM
jgi:hypothetical protein